MLAHSFNDVFSNYGSQTYIAPSSVGNSAIPYSLYALSRNSLNTKRLDNIERSFLQVEDQSGALFRVVKTTLSCDVNGRLTVTKSVVASTPMPVGFPEVKSFYSISRPRNTTSLGLDSIIRIGSKTYCVLNQLSSGRCYLFEFLFNEIAGTVTLNNTGIIVSGGYNIQFIHYDQSSGYLYSIWEQIVGSGTSQTNILRMTRIEIAPNGGFSSTDMMGTGSLSTTQQERASTGGWHVAFGTNSSGQQVLSFIRFVGILNVSTNMYTLRRQALNVTSISGAPGIVTEVQASNSVLVGQVDTLVWSGATIIFLNSLGNVVVSGSGSVVAYDMNTAEAGTAVLGTLVIRDIDPAVNAPSYTIFRLP